MPMTLSRPLRIGGIVAAALVVLLVLLTAALWVVQRDRVLPNTSVVGVDVSRMTADEVRTALVSVVDERLDDTVTVTFEGTDHELEPATAGYEVDLDATAMAALARGRDASFPRDLRERIASLRGHAVDLPLVDGYDVEAVIAWTDALADALDRESSSGLVEVDPATLEVRSERPTGSVEVDRVALQTQVTAALVTPGSELIELPAATTVQTVPDDEFDAVLAQFERAVSAPITLALDDEQLVVEPELVAALITYEVTEHSEVRAEPALVVGEDRAEELLGEDIEATFGRSPVNARYSSSRTPPRTFDAQGSTSFSPVAAQIEVEGGRDGLTFDAAISAEQLTAALREGSRELEPRLATVEAELSPDRARELRPTHLISTFTTYFTAGQARSRNIQRLADIIDDALVLPGEQFSINNISGERTCDRGFLPAGTIVAGELVDTCGGGVSQFGTTAFNAAFFAGVQLDQWKAHSWYISRYPMGREATLSYPALDVRFTNTTDGAIIVRSSHTATSVTVSVYGQPRATAVRASHGSPFAQRPFPTTERGTDELFEDQERVVQPGTGGFTVEVVRTVELNGGGEETQTIRTVYVPQTRIIEVGTRERPEPEPEPEPDPDPAPADPEPDDD